MKIDQDWTQFELFYEGVSIIRQHKDDTDPGTLELCGVKVQWNQQGVRITIPNELDPTPP